MPTAPTLGGRLAALAIATGSLGGLAHAGQDHCTVYRLGMPDFDQLRSALPNDGRMYCFPTASLNALAYMTNHGLPGILGAPRDWADPALYNLTTVQIQALGILMGTDAVHGTSGDIWRRAMRSYLDANGGAFVTVHVFRASTFGILEPRQLNSAMAAGAIVLPWLGWYEQVLPGGSTLYERQGGHAVTMLIGLNACGPVEDYVLGFRDPGNDGVLTGQGPFTTTFTGFHYIPGAEFKRGEETEYTQRLIARADIYAGGHRERSGFLDAYSTFMPLAGLITPPGTGDLELFVPEPFTSEPGPKRFPFSPLGIGAQSAALDIHPTRAFVVSETREIRDPYRLHVVDMVTGESTEIDRFRLRPRGNIAVGRDGSVYLSTSTRRIARYTPVLDRYEPSGDISLDSTIDALLFDDDTDELLALSVADRRLIRLSTGRELLVRANNTIPSPIPLLGDGSVAINPIDGREWVAGSDSPTITRLQRDAAGRILPEALVTLPGVASPRALQFGDDGTLYVVESRTVLSFEPDGAGGWRRSASPLDGARTEGLLRVARGRDNWDPSMAGPDDINLLPEDLGLGQFDCRADLNLDGQLDIFDFLEFQNLFARGSTYADFDHDGGLTIFDFLAFQNAFAAGCP